MKKRFTTVLCLLVFPTLLPAQGSDGEVRDLRATITGNQEQPQVLYLVPWKEAQGDAAIPYRPVRGQVRGAFPHVDSSEHLRELELLQRFRRAE